MTATYTVTTWDMEEQDFTPQDGLSVPSERITLWSLRPVLRELYGMGFSEMSIYVERDDQ